MVNVCARLANVSKFSLSPEDKYFNICLRNFHEKVKNYHCAKDHASTVCTLATLRTFAFLYGGLMLANVSKFSVSPEDKYFNIYLRNFHEKVENYHCAKDHVSTVCTLATLRTFAFLYGGLMLDNVSKFSLSPEDKYFNIYLRNFHEKVKNYHCAKDHVSTVCTLATLRTFAFLYGGLMLDNVSKFSLSPEDKYFNIYLRNFHEKVKNYHCAKDHVSTVCTLATLRTFAFLYGGLMLDNVSKFSLSPEDKYFNIYLRKFHKKVKNYHCAKDHASTVCTLATLRTFAFLYGGLRLANVSKFSLSPEDKYFNIYLRNFHKKVKNYHCAKDHASTVCTLDTLRTFAFLYDGFLLQVTQCLKIQPISLRQIF